MIRTVAALAPPAARGAAVRLGALTAASILLRAGAVLALVPLIVALVDRVRGAAPAWLAVLTAAIAAGWAVDTVAGRIAHGIGFALLDTGQRRIADRLTRIRLTWFDAEHTALARQVVAATGPDLVGVVIYLLTPLMTAMLLPTVLTIALLVMCWPLGLVLACGLPLAAGALWAGERLTRRAAATADRAETEVAERIVEFARAQPELRAARRAGPDDGPLGDALTRRRSALLRVLAWDVPGGVLFSLVVQAMLITVAIVAGWQAVGGRVGAAETVALVIVAACAIEPLTTLSDLAPGLNPLRRMLRRMDRVLRAPVDPAGEAEPPTGAGVPRITLRGVGFSYGDPQTPVLTDLDLELAPGSTTAIVGASGSGKSTVLGLIGGLHHPDTGTVAVDGVDLARLDPEARRALVTAVFQEPYLFADTIAANIASGDPQAGPERRAEVRTRARVDEITDRLPDGADTPVGGGGGALSGGERQRVSIARALLKPAPILLIDEATSALDTENEAAVVAALSAGDRPRTTVIVAHRRAAIARVDRVVVLERGRIVEDGTPAELRAAGGAFARFWAGQEASERWRLTGDTGPA